MININRDGAWLVLSFLWSLNGPVERMLLQHHDWSAYAYAKALAVGLSYALFATPAQGVQEGLSIFGNPFMWVLFGVSVLNTPINAHIIKHGHPAIQLPMAQVLSNVFRSLWWAILLQKPLTVKQYFGIAFAAAGCVCLS